MKKEKKNLSPTLEEVISQSVKQYGEGIISVGERNCSITLPRISTRSPSIDWITNGGFPEGRIVEVYGPTSCLMEDTYISYEVWKNQKRLNHKGGTIARLYERFKKVKLDNQPKQGRHLQENDCEYYVKSVDDEGKILKNRVLNVIATGKKQCWKLQTVSGEEIYSTAEHQYLTPKGFKPLSDLSIDDEIFIHNNVRKKGYKNYLNRPEVFVKYHPYWPIKKIKDSLTKKEYIYHRGQKSRATYEAYINNMSTEQYINFLNTKTITEISNLKFIPKELHVHHKDENFNNNAIENLELVSPSFHGLIHITDRLKNLGFIVIPVKIAAITKDKEYETFDLQCAYPYNNYIANNIVVHNSGKTTLALHTTAEVQSRGERVLYVDIEQTLDLEYATKLGVDIEDLILSQPDSAEQALNIIETFARTGEVKLIVLDSVANLVPQVEIEGAMEDQQMGLQARLMSKACRKLAPIIHKTGTLLFFLNQIRSNIGGYGSPNVTSGGNALPFNASIRLEIKRGATIERGDQIVGNEVRAKVTKSKVGPPYRIADIRILYGLGIDWATDILRMAVEAGVVEKSGAWYSYGTERLGQGEGNTAELIRSNVELKEKLLASITSIKNGINAEV